MPTINTNAINQIQTATYPVGPTTTPPSRTIVKLGKKLISKKILTNKNFKNITKKQMKVNFSKDSWHYKFFRACFDDKESDWDNYDWNGPAPSKIYSLQDPSSLCPYFWLIVACFLTLPFSWVGIVMTETGLSKKIKADTEGFGAKCLSGLLFYLWVAALGLIVFGTYSLFLVCLAEPFLFYVLLAVSLVGFGCYRYWGQILEAIKRKNSKTVKSSKVKKKSSPLVKSYFKAVKKKICPIINWEE